MTMKQRIAVDQLNELTDDQKDRLRDWYYPENVRMYDQYVYFDKKRIAFCQDGLSRRLFLR